MDLLLASSSRYRAEVLAAAGFRVTSEAPDVDERSLDHWLAERGAEALALELARRKLASVQRRVTTTSLILAADQVGVLPTGRGPVLLTKSDGVEAAVAQLRALSGTTHRLVNGLVLAHGARVASGVDVVEVTFRDLDEEEVRAYVERFEPFDTAGSYRLEDDDRAERPPFVVAVRGEDPSGVLGLPLPLLRRLLRELGFEPPP